MRILVGWDDPGEAELIRMYLNVGDDPEATIVVTDAEEFQRLATTQEHWNAILMSVSHPDIDTGFNVFQQIREYRPDCPVVGACRSEDVFRIARFLTNGLRSYILRDASGDYMFLLSAIMDAALKQADAEREREVAEKLRREIDSVRRLQESIIPQHINSPNGYEIVARYESSQIRVLGGQPVTMAGGDYYDAFFLPDDTIVLLVGDASGHGMKACMSIMTMHALIQMIRTERFRDPATLVGYINERLCKQKVVNEDGGFITLLYGVLDPKTNVLTWSSAGHPVPMLQNLATGEVRNVSSDDACGQQVEIPLGSRLIFYTDGLAEAFNGLHDEQHAEFGIPGISQTLQANCHVPLADALLKLFDDSNAFTRGQGRHDDTSVLLLERHAEPPIVGRAD
jgi:serine phosphatase RsbU (regulator of sigma subunit)